MTSVPNRTGRIFPHQRNANFSGAILGDDIKIDDEYVSNVHSVEQHTIKEHTKRKHRNAIKNIYEFWCKEFSEYAAIGVRDLTVDKLRDPTMFWWKNKKDLVYEGMNPKFLKAFLSTKVIKKNGQTTSYDHIRKYFDAVQFGAKEISVLLPVGFYSAKERFLKAFHKQVAKAKGEGKLDENEADPIPKKLYVLINKWAIEEGNIHVWAWTCTQWNVIGRCNNVEVLGFHNLRIFQDSLQIKYDANKKDPNGSKVNIKNVYANPFTPSVCTFTALGVYICLNRHKYAESERIFQMNKSEKARIASTSYCSQLKEILNRHCDTVRTFVREDHANAYGLRKGGATYATAGTTCPPDTVVVARRGEWSMSKVLDIYMHFAQSGDCFLGRVLACLDALKPSFNVLPPHFNMEKPLENADILEAMRLMYGPILDVWKHDSKCDPTSVLLRLLASVIYHFDWIKSIARIRTDHPFNAIPLMFQPEIVSALKLLITIDVHESTVIEEATGIPPHVEHSIRIQELLGVANECLLILKDQVLDIKNVSAHYLVIIYYVVILFIYFNTIMFTFNFIIIASSTGIFRARRTKWTSVRGEVERNFGRVPV